MPRWDYRVADVVTAAEGDTVTRLNGQVHYRGVSGEQGQPVWEFLAEWAGRDWELVAAYSVGANQARLIIRKPA